MLAPSDTGGDASASSTPGAAFDLTPDGRPDTTSSACKSRVRYNAGLALASDPGHVFITRGDIRFLACDAWLLPGNADAGPESPGVSSEWFAGAPHLSEHFEAGRLRDPASAQRADRVWQVPADGGGGPSVYLVQTGGHTAHPVEWYIAALDQFLEVVRARSDVRTGRDRRLIAVPLIGTGRGGQAKRRGPMVEALLRRLYDEAARTDTAADYVLVTFRGGDFAAAQAMRRRFSTTAAWSALARPQLAEIATRLGREAIAGRLVLFLGAGVGSGAGLPMWDDLLRRLAGRARMADEDVAGLLALDPLDAARLIHRRLDKQGDDLGRAVADELRGDRFSLSHALLASLPVREVATTNYDTLFEKASEGAGRPTAVLPYRPDPDRDRWILKLHGSVEHPEEIVLTRDDYLAYSERRAALAGLVQGLLITKHMLFVGFSLKDENFHRIAHDVRKAIRPHGGPIASKFGTAVVLDEDKLQAELWSEDLDLATTAVPGATGLGPASRQLEIFLDRLLFAASTGAVHLLDPAYDGLLTPEEVALAKGLQDLVAHADSTGSREAEAWSRVAEMLHDLGWTRNAGP